MTTTDGQGKGATAEQSCNECRRRKARCDRILAGCGLCTQHRRDCLYEKHTRTPLTRKHLTDVEERLERAEALIKRLKTNNQTAAGEAGLGHASVPPRVPPPSFAAAHAGPPSAVPVLQPKAVGPVINGRQTEGDLSLGETPPQDDFEWDEQDGPSSLDESFPGHAVRTDGTDVSAPDGMASLPVSEKEAGYLGVASGAALLRIMEPPKMRRNSRSRPRRPSSTSTPVLTMLSAPDPGRHIADAMIDAYFRRYHLSYPIIHEATFRAQWAEVIPQPHGKCWLILAYTIAAIGVYSSSDNLTSDLDLELFAHARSMLSFDHLELGNLTLVQALTLISNYQQKRDKPNSGYNYLGLAVRMATGLGLHKEFAGWKISPLQMEIRRRVWWSLCVFDVGATITFSRPTVWPYEGVEVAFPLNVTDRDLTANTKTYPSERTTVTPYTSVGVQAKFHVATNRIYSRVISKPFPTAEELLRLEADLLATWRDNIPDCFRADAVVAPAYALAHAVMRWRYLNFRIIMYRPFVMRIAFARRNDPEVLQSAPAADVQSYERCLEDAHSTIEAISKYWSANEHNRLAAWYALYFLFQAVLIPCMCLRNSPLATEAPSWCEQVALTLSTIRSMATVNASCHSCYEVIVGLCGRYISSGVPETLPVGSSPEISVGDLHRGSPATITTTSQQQHRQQQQDEELLRPIDDSPQTQINQIFPMMWPNVNALEAAGEVLANDAWLSFLDGDGIGGDYDS